MKILEEYPTKLLTNFELLCLLRERHSERNSASSSKISDDRIGGVNDITSMKYLPKNVAFIEYQVILLDLIYFPKFLIFQKLAIEISRRKRVCKGAIHVR